MAFNKFIIIIGECLGVYYFIIILFDLLKINNRILQTTTHSVHFEKSEKPIVISEDSQEKNHPFNLEIDEDLNTFLPSDDLENSEEVVKKKSPIIDLGLETISGDAYTLSAENLSKFMIA